MPSPAFRGSIFWFCFEDWLSALRFLRYPVQIKRSRQILCGEFVVGHLAALTVHWTVIHYRSAVRFAHYLRVIRPRAHNPMISVKVRSPINAQKTKDILLDVLCFLCGKLRRFRYHRKVLLECRTFVRLLYYNFSPRKLLKIQLHFLKYQANGTKEAYILRFRNYRQMPDSFLKNMNYP